MNDALGANSTVSGGYDKLARDLSSVGGGTGNIASGVAGLDPRLVTRNARGDVEGVKYERLSVLLVGSVQELAERDRLQSAELAEWRRRLERLEARAAR